MYECMYVCMFYFPFHRNQAIKMIDIVNSLFLLQNALNIIIFVNVVEFLV